MWETMPPSLAPSYLTRKCNWNCSLNWNQLKSTEINQPQFQYLNRFTEFASAAPMTVHSEDDEAETNGNGNGNGMGSGELHIPLKNMNSRDSAQSTARGGAVMDESMYQLSHAQVLDPSDVEWRHVTSSGDVEWHHATSLSHMELTHVISTTTSVDDAVWHRVTSLYDMEVWRRVRPSNIEW